MTNNEQNEMRKTLIQQRQKVLNDVSRHGVMSGSTAGAISDEAERAEKIADTLVELQLGYKESKLLEKIDLAIERLDDGTYGICKDCGGDIGLARLQAKPYSSLCIDCQSAKEQNKA
ncbi:RNA polymerase-binding transcription factor DksA [Oceaniferula spumae]|uniref:RNA polymerase-binding transcription factor DksA n=1 Tax=Oceaniferula spumae TaxID=2979115 RepID=A0AAT9FPZ9_9BACT